MQDLQLPETPATSVIPSRIMEPTVPAEVEDQNEENEDTKKTTPVRKLASNLVMFQLKWGETCVFN